MQLTIEDISPVEKRVDFELPWGEVGPRLDRAYDKLRREVHLKGFRPGKAPRAVLEKLYRPQVEDDVARELIEISIGQAINDKQIEPVAPPVIDKLELKSGAPFRFSAKVAVRSNVTPKDYTGLSLEARPARVTDAQVEEAVARHRRRLTQVVRIEGRDTLADDDMVLVEIHGRVGTNKIKRRVVIIDLAQDKGGPLPGLAGKLRGLPLSAKETEIRYTLGDDVSPRELANLDVAVRVTIKEARQRRIPALDDEFAKDTGLAETMDGLKEKLREELLEADKKAIREELKDKVIDVIIERNDFPIAPALVARYEQAMLERLKIELAMAGVDLESSGLDPKGLRTELSGKAEREARADVLLQAIGEREGIEVTDADVQKRIAEIAAQRDEPMKKVRAELEQSGRLASLRRQLCNEKTLDFLLSQAKITEVDPDRLIVTPAEARAGKGAKLIVTPAEAAEEADRAEAEMQAELLALEHEALLQRTPRK